MRFFRYARFAALTLLGLATSAGAAPTVYVPLGSANAVAVIDAAEDEVVATIPGVINAHGLAATSDGDRLVAGSLMTRKAGQALPKPQGMEESEHQAHHSSAGGKEADSANRGTLYLLDGEARRIRHKIPVPAAIHHNAITPDGTYAISTHPTTGGVSVVDLNRRKVIKEIATGPAPNYAVTSPSGDRVYVSNAGNDTVSVIDTEHWIVRLNLLAGKAPEHLAIAPGGKRLYAANVAAGTVSAIDLKRGAVTATFEVGAKPHGVAVSPDGNTLYATSKGQDRLVAIDLTSGERRTRELTPAPYHVAVIGGTGKLYVSSRQQPKIWVVDADSLAVIGTIAIEGRGHQMAVTQQSG